MELCCFCKDYNNAPTNIVYNDYTIILLYGNSYKLTVKPLINDSSKEDKPPYYKETKSTALCTK